MKHDECNCAIPLAKEMAQPLSDDEHLLIDRLLGSMAFPDKRIDEVVLGQKQIFIRAGNRTGLATNLGSFCQRRVSQVDSVRGKTLLEAASLLYDDLLLNRSLAAAALNAALAPQCDQKSPNALDLILQEGKGQDVVIVGDFPFIERIREVAARIFLLELKDVPGRLEPKKWDEALESCRVAAITGTALLTRCMARYLKASSRAYQVVLGATVPLSPVLMNDYGADVLAGSIVEDEAKTRQGVTEGLSISRLHRTGCLRFCNLTRRK